MTSRSTSQQQQPSGDRVAQEQQTAGSNEFQEQGRPDKPQQQMGEGSYEASRDYKERIERYVKNADIEADAEKARPRSEQEAREMKQAEEEGKSHSKGED